MAKEKDRWQEDENAGEKTPLGPPVNSGQPTEDDHTTAKILFRGLRLLREGKSLHEIAETLGNEFPDQRGGLYAFSFLLEYFTGQAREQAPERRPTRNHVRFK